MRISDWSSDVCSADLHAFRKALAQRLAQLLARIGGDQIGRTLGHRLVKPFAETGDRRQGRELLEVRQFAGQVVNHPLDQEITEGNATQAGLGIRDRIEDRRVRSEEHTSELQSLMRRSYAV